MMSKNGIKILVVDDDEIVREVISSLLISEGYAVVSARDGLEAIKTLKMEKIHLVITDLRMPGADGIEVLRESIRLEPDRAVIILTAFGTLDIALKAIREGAYDYMTKPFKMEEMIIRVNNAYERTLLVVKIKALIKSLREILTDMMLLKEGDNNHNRIIMDWVDNIEHLKKMDILDKDEASMIKERLIGEW
ncbi:MAG: response regulator [Thermodesulfobacteriota bacterium]